MLFEQCSVIIVVIFSLSTKIECLFALGISNGLCIYSFKHICAIFLLIDIKTAIYRTEHSFPSCNKFLLPFKAFSKIKQLFKYINFCTYDILCTFCLVNILSCLNISWLYIKLLWTRFRTSSIIHLPVLAHLY